MIYNYPFFGVPNYLNYNLNSPNQYVGKNIGSIQNKKREDEDPLFNFGGIPLYFDDVLLICLILFLYNEKIDDYYLLLALVLLLLG